MATNKPMVVKIQASEITNVKAILSDITNAMTRCKKGGHDDWLEMLKPIENQVHIAWKNMIR